MARATNKTMPEEQITEAPAFTNIFDFIKDVSHEKKNIYDLNPEAAGKIYSRYMADLMLSQHADCIMIINELNCRPNMPARWHYDYLLAKLPMRKRFAKLTKPDVGERVQLLVDFFGYSVPKALEVIDMFVDADFEEIREKLFTGGLAGKAKKRG